MFSGGIGDGPQCTVLLPPRMSCARAFLCIRRSFCVFKLALQSLCIVPRAPNGAPVVLLLFFVVDDNMPSGALARRVLLQWSEFDHGGSPMKSKLSAHNLRRT